MGKGGPTCFNCGERVGKGKLDEHIGFCWPECKHCGQSVKDSNLEEHEANCN